MQKKYGKTSNKIRGRVKAMNGEFSGGTIASLGATMASLKAKPDLIKVLANPFSLTEGFQGPNQPDDSKPIFDEELGMWVAPCDGANQYKKYPPFKCTSRTLIW